MTGDENKPPPDAPPPRVGTGASGNVELDGNDEADSTTVEAIIAALRASLPEPTGAWNEQKRNEAEFHAWLNGRRRICDMAGAA